MSKCDNCGAEAFNKCSACLGPFYCSKECQRGHWAQHKPECERVRREEKEKERKKQLLVAMCKKMLGDIHILVSHAPESGPVVKVYEEYDAFFARTVIDDLIVKLSRKEGARAGNLLFVNIEVIFPGGEIEEVLMPAPARPDRVKEKNKFEDEDKMISII